MIPYSAIRQAMVQIESDNTERADRKQAERRYAGNRKQRRAAASVDKRAQRVVRRSK